MHAATTSDRKHTRRRLRLPRALQIMKFLGAWLVPWRSAFLTRAEPSKLQFFVSCRDAIGRHVAKYGGFEPELTAWIGARLPQAPKGIVIGVGANLGWHSVHAAKYDAVENIVAFEPDAFNAWLLERNLAINRVDKVIVQACAVGSTRGRTDVLITEYSPALSRSGNLSVDEMIDGLVAGGFIPHLLAADGGIARIDRGDLGRVDGQVDVIWTR